MGITRRTGSGFLRFQHARNLERQIQTAIAEDHMVSDAIEDGDVHPQVESDPPGRDKEGQTQYLPNSPDEVYETKLQAIAAAMKLAHELEDPMVDFPDQAHRDLRADNILVDEDSVYIVVNTSKVYPNRSTAIYRRATVEGGIKRMTAGQQQVRKQDSEQSD